MDCQKHSLACSSEGCAGGRPILLGAEEDMEKQEQERRDNFDELEDKVCTDVVEVGESEDSEDAEVVMLVEVDEVKVGKTSIKIVEVDIGKENGEDGVEMTEGMPGGTCTGALPCWLCGEACEVGDQVREVEQCQ